MRAVIALGDVPRVLAAVDDALVPAAVAARRSRSDAQPSGQSDRRRRRQRRRPRPRPPSLERERERGRRGGVHARAAAAAAEHPGGQARRADAPRARHEEVRREPPLCGRRGLGPVGATLRPDVRPARVRRLRDGRVAVHALPPQVDARLRAVLPPQPLEHHPQHRGQQPLRQPAGQHERARRLLHRAHAGQRRRPHPHRGRPLLLDHPVRDRARPPRLPLLEPRGDVRDRGAHTARRVAQPHRGRLHDHGLQHRAVPGQAPQLEGVHAVAQEPARPRREPAGGPTNGGERPCRGHHRQPLRDHFSRFGEVVRFECRSTTATSSSRSSGRRGSRTTTPTTCSTSRAGSGGGASRKARHPAAARRSRLALQRPRGLDARRQPG